MKNIVRVYRCGGFNPETDEQKHFITICFDDNTHVFINNNLIDSTKNQVNEYIKKIKNERKTNEET